MFLRFNSILQQYLDCSKNFWEGICCYTIYQICFKENTPNNKSYKKFPFQFSHEVNLDCWLRFLPNIVSYTRRENLYLINNYSSFVLFSKTKDVSFLDTAPKWKTKTRKNTNKDDKDAYTHFITALLFLEAAVITNFVYYKRVIIKAL